MTRPRSLVKSTSMKSVSEEEFELFLKKNPLLIPNGFKIVGAYLQTSWLLNGVEMARTSFDSHGRIYEIMG